MSFLWVWALKWRALSSWCLPDDRSSRARAQVKFFVFSPLSISLRVLWQLSSSSKQDKGSDRWVIDGLTSITSITNSLLFKFKRNAQNHLLCLGTHCPRPWQWVPRLWDQEETDLCCYFSLPSSSCNRYIEWQHPVRRWHSIHSSTAASGMIEISGRTKKVSANPARAWRNPCILH